MGAITAFPEGIVGECPVVKEIEPIEDQIGIKRTDNGFHLYIDLESNLRFFSYFCSSFWGVVPGNIGAWRSWLAYLHGVQGVGSSSLLAPTELKRGDRPGRL